MSLRQVYPPLRFDWRRFFSEIESGTADQFVSHHLTWSAVEAARYFSLCISDEELMSVRRWIQQTNSGSRDLVHALIERAPLIRTTPLDLIQSVKSGEFPSPSPKAVVTTTLHREELPGKVGETIIESGMMFPRSALVEEASTHRTQPFSWGDTTREELWTLAMKPFCRADQILICDPYALCKAATMTNPLDSGLGFFIEKFRLLADEDRRDISIHVMSANGGQYLAPLSETHFTATVRALSENIGSRVTVEATMVKPQTGKNNATLHARYLIARHGSVETRVMFFDNSVIADAKLKPSSKSRILNLSLYYAPEHIRKFTGDWNRAIGLAQLHVSSKDF